MKIKQFLDLMNFTSDVIVEVCDTDLSLDNRKRLYWGDIHRGDYSGFENRKVSSFTIRMGTLTIYAG